MENIMVEFTSALWKKVRTKEINSEDAMITSELVKAVADIIKNWIRTCYTVEFLGTWEQIKNPNFKVVEFDHFKTQEGL